MCKIVPTWNPLDSGRFLGVSVGDTWALCPDTQHPILPLLTHPLGQDTPLLGGDTPPDTPSHGLALLYPIRIVLSHFADLKMDLK